MRVIADLHIHSRFARACSKELNLPNLDRFAKVKGLQVLGTGDAFHPAWLKELREGLVEAEQGLYTINPKEGTRFMLSTEVSCIYKHRDRVRRLHHLIYAPGFSSIDGMIEELNQRGCNLKSDGRPIIGVTSEDLLRIVLRHGGTLIPAHAWTPWFAVFGSKSGYDSLEECFGDLVSQVFAVETGLSSDPLMNWTVSALDTIALISNSDAHSLPNLGREANVLELTNLSYTQIMEAIKNGAPARRQAIGKEKLSTLSHINSTIEFYPEEGMYHFDGHRACGVRWDPAETKRRGGTCPTCGLTVTVGVMNRVAVLADRHDAVPPAGAPLYHHLVELDKIIAEAMGVKSRSSKKVQEQYWKIIEGCGNEMDILLNLPLKQITTVSPARVVEGIRRVRAEQVTVTPGYDGVYGSVQIFTPQEKVEAKAVKQTMLL